MEIPDTLHCLFSGTLEDRNGSYVIDVPKRELQLGDIEPGATYRVALLPTSQSTPDTGAPDPSATSAGPPVTEGDIREVEIETLGEQGDGIARTDQGYVIIVPDTAVGDTVRVKLTDVQDNVGFATVIDHARQ